MSLSVQCCESHLSSGQLVTGGISQTQLWLETLNWCSVYHPLQPLLPAVASPSFWCWHANNWWRMSNTRKWPNAACIRKLSLFPLIYYIKVKTFWRSLYRPEIGLADHSDEDELVIALDHIQSFMHENTQLKWQSRLPCNSDQNPPFPRTAGQRTWKSEGLWFH